VTPVIWVPQTIADVEAIRTYMKTWFWLPDEVSTNSLKAFLVANWDTE
jgi:hypothetical protein